MGHKGLKGVKKQYFFRSNNHEKLKKGYLIYPFTYAAGSRLMDLVGSAWRILRGMRWRSHRYTDEFWQRHNSARRPVFHLYPVQAEETSSIILEVTDLSFNYPHGRTIFRGASFDVGRGEVLSILGPNGSGKSTLLNCIAIPSAQDYKIADEALERMGIAHLRNKPYTEISGGERQQVTIARVIAQQPQLILLDEPTAHLDYGNQHRVIRMLQQLVKEKYALIMTAHNPEHAIILDGKVAILNREGMLSVGQAAERLNATTLSNLYGLSIKTTYDEDAKRTVCIVC